MQNILITGISGFIGQYLYRFALPNFYITGTYLKNKPALKTINLRICDLSKVDKFIETASKYDVVIHCAANANLKKCELEPDQAFRINTHATEKLVEWSTVQKSRFVFLSTDIVFDGNQGEYTEDDIPNPINIYGKTKANAEEVILKNHQNAVIARLALCLGKNNCLANSFIDWFLQMLQSEKEIPLFIDEIRTPVSAQFMAKAIWKLVLSDYNGIIHVSGKEKIDRFHLGKSILQHLKSDKENLLKKATSEDIDYPRPKDVSMKSKYLENIIGLPQEDIYSLIKNIL